MFGILKRKVKASELGAMLANLAMDTSNIEQMVAEGRKDHPFDDSLMDESLFLQLFSVDFAASGVLGQDSTQKKVLLDSYYNHILALAEKMDSMDSGAGKAFYADFQRRLLVYAKAVNTPHHKGPWWNVGKEFARLCRKEEDLDTVMFGNFLFWASVKWVTESIRSCRIVL